MPLQDITDESLSNLNSQELMNLFNDAEQEQASLSELAQHAKFSQEQHASNMQRLNDESQRRYGIPISELEQSLEEDRPRLREMQIAFIKGVRANMRLRDEVEALRQQNQ